MMCMIHIMTSNLAFLPMTNNNLVVRQIDTDSGWVIDRVNRDGHVEQLAGVYTSAYHARAWTISNRSKLLQEE